MIRCEGILAINNEVIKATLLVLWSIGLIEEIATVLDNEVSQLLGGEGFVAVGA